MNANLFFLIEKKFYEMFYMLKTLKDKLLYFFVKHKFFVLYKWAAILIMIKTKTKFSLIKESILLK